MTEDLLTIVCYDIVSSKKRRRIAEMLEKIAVRVQDSVFEGWFTPSEADRLVAELEPWLAERDSLRLYMVTTAGLRHVRTVGPTPPAAQRNYYLL